MSLKKKLGLGAASAALGLSLIGGGTFAYFNDNATINNAFAAGTLDLVVGDVQNEAINFDLTNLKPGDKMDRRFVLKNNGTIAIKDVLLDARAYDWVDGNQTPDSTMDDFLKQFKIDILRAENGYSENANTIIASGQELTLYDLVYSNALATKLLNSGDRLVGDRINIASPIGTDDDDGLTVDPNDTDMVIFRIEFKNDGNQNKYQGDAVKFSFDLEARQWDGVTITENDPNGKVNNGKEQSANGESQPDPIVTPGSTVTDLEDVQDNPLE
jgi:spore coat-associated protein N